MNILIIHNKYQIPGGEDTVVKNEIDLLRDKGNQVFLYERNNSELNQMTRLQKMLLPFTMIFSFKSYREIRKMIRDNHIEVVHVHNTLLLISFAAYYAAKKENCRLVQTLHNFRFVCANGMLFRNGKVCEQCLKKGYSNAIKHGCYRNSKAQTLMLVAMMNIHRIIGTFKKVDVFLALTDFNKKIVSKYIPADKIQVKPNAVANSKGKNNDQPRQGYLYVGRLEKEKGIDILIDAFKELDGQVSIVGTGTEEARIKEYLSQNAIHNIIMQGSKSHAEVLDAMSHAKALIFPTQWYEGMPMTIIESLSVGTPVIVSDIGNAAEMVTDDYNGYHFVYNDKESLKKVIQSFDNKNLDSLIQNSYLEYEKKYTQDVNYNMLLKAYKQ